MDAPPPIIDYPRVPPVGAVLQVHGGGWEDTEFHQREYRDRVAARWTQRGWVVFSIRYTPFSGSLDSVVEQYDRLRASYSGRIVVTGQSAGGQLALMLATKRSPHAVIVEGAPTYMTSKHLPAHTYALAKRAWGTRTLEMSPTLRKRAISGKRILLSTSRCDPNIPLDQQNQYVKRHVDATRVEIPCGDGVPYTHGTTSPAGRDRLYAAERALLRQADGLGK